MCWSYQPRGGGAISLMPRAFEDGTARDLIGDGTVPVGEASLRGMRRFTLPEW